MVTDLSAGEKLDYVSPVPTSLTNSRCYRSEEYLPGQPEPASPGSSVLAETLHVCVPDVIVYSPAKPCFALNIEIKKPNEDMGRGRLQCLTQILTQMHFQQAHFGLLLSAMRWCLILVVKVNDKLHVLHYNERLYKFGSPGTTQYPVHFDLDKFKSMNKWIYRILKWKKDQF